MMDTKTKMMLDAGESGTVEFKLSFDREAIETLVAFANTKGVMDFIKKHINKAYIITGRPQREERWDYPLNAIIHRDYTSPADSIIKVYNDKIEFFNPGKLPNGLTVTRLLKGDYVSIARNKKIAEAFKSAGLIEKYGSGIKRILN